MIYTFRLFSKESPLFERIISLDADAMFIDLCRIILDSVHYTNDNITSFFVCDEDWEKRVEITQVDMNNNPEIDSWVMDKTPLSEMLDEEGQRLMFMFDYLTERCFYLFLDKVEKGHQDAPKLLSSTGKAPAQTIDFKELEKKPAASKKKGGLDLDDTLYGEDGFNDDELEDFNDDLGEEFGGGGYSSSEPLFGGDLLDDF